MSEGVSFETAAERIDEGTAAGNEYIDNLESIRDELTVQDGSTLGTMIGGQLLLTEAETIFMTKKALPKKASDANKEAAQEVKKAVG